MPFKFRNELLVLDIFTENFSGNDVSFGIMFTSRKLLQILALAMMGQEKEVLEVTDGTYKLDFINWTLVSDYYAVNDENLYGLKVTKVRTTKYAKSLKGILHVEGKSLLAVDVEHHKAIFRDWTSPIWTDLEKDFGSSNEKKPFLTRQGLSQGEYTVGALTTRLIENPASVTNWSSGARYWGVYFRKQEAMVTMAVEQLSNTINYSFRMGHHILPKK
ncbi:hypothetical protein PHMEG_00034925 [Phytophthora megakarya]|uniref:Uncharacterized protein n=1 Tax=Phytophthora megakarya TaxID=4795 RepID=A0A225UQB1_9STRA|nr:hypothetical protein PHMEG_00034925 [Phytophthora megakarya]